ncbi:MULTISPECIES: MmpS family transport accessory protein [Mycobacteriaceae]|uniref:MmpS family protein n=1 Tax=Mycolicibacterium parafortuitum TaxID=39692 RepID=A0ACC6MF70_MYCPF|nr:MULTISPECIES: MmpS family transport accessory protein [Mycobacteriaceae]MDZ5085266.1 MmpS family protein [Mycolicibacterium parafortuitum]GFM17563.1 transmembrane proteinm MmpS5 [Mycobacterium sp. PO1]GFM21862.1 transmembrane proteinm MmpS5 [Mycobacterium sp. PO2]
MTALAKRVWLPVLIVIAVVIGATTVSQLREAFGANPVLVTPTGNNTAESFNPKVVTYEVFGSGSTGVINYVDLDGIPQRVENAALPWSLTLSTTVPAVSANILAQSDGDDVTCRILVDGELEQENTATGVNAQTVCVVKSA